MYYNSTRTLINIFLFYFLVTIALGDLDLATTGVLGNKIYLFFTNLFGVFKYLMIVLIFYIVNYRYVSFSFKQILFIFPSIFSVFGLLYGVGGTYLSGIVGFFIWDNIQFFLNNEAFSLFYFMTMFIVSSSMIAYNKKTKKRIGTETVYRRKNNAQINLKNIFKEKLEKPKSKAQFLKNNHSEGLIAALEEYGFSASSNGFVMGPVVTQYKIKLASGTKISSLMSIQDDIARTLSVKNLRISGNIRGTNLIGVEIANENIETVNIADIISSAEFQQTNIVFPVILGKSTSGKAVIEDLTKFPHLLVAGTTGSGKSCGINSILAGILYKSLVRNKVQKPIDGVFEPKDLRMILIDPKMVEMSPYEGIPHLLSPVVDSHAGAVSALNWAVDEMESRYKTLKKFGVKSLSELRKKAPKEYLPYIIIVIDELADLMAVSQKEIELPLARLLQKSRASGINLIVATQRPSTQVINGILKANLPTRICFSVANKVDSRVVLDIQGAERLLGRGDMLFSMVGAEPIRIHGSFISEDEIKKLVDQCKSLGTPVYKNNFEIDLESNRDDNISMKKRTPSFSSEYKKTDLIIREILEYMETTDYISVSKIQRRFKIGYNKAATIIDFFEESGIVSEKGKGGIRKILSTNI